MIPRAKIVRTLLLLVAFVLIGQTASCASKGNSSTDYYTTDFIHTDHLPFSFNYGGQAAAALLKGVTPTIRKQALSDHVQQIEKVWRCNDGLVVTLTAKYYTDYDATEWITYLKYEGKGKSKVITDLYGIDEQFPIQVGSDVVIHTNKGDDCTKYSYEPYDIILKRGQKEEFYPKHGSGKSTTGPRGWPYWNIQNGSHGWIIAVGWPGVWQNTISRNDDESFSVIAGQKTFNAYLNPSETIRTPLICVLPWDASDVASAQNIWRRFYIDHIIPRFNGEPEWPATEIQVEQKESNISYVQRYIDAGIKPRICWTDAGWYPTNTGTWLETGEWKLNKDLYPNGIKPFSTWAHKEGMESLLWFEPERVRGNNSLTKNHQDWLLTVPGWKSQILNLGNPECLDWLINHISKLIVDNGLDWYREDMNEDGPYWPWYHADMKLGKERQGITENLYIQGHLAFWDALKERNPNLHIDACASGGRRNDLETMHRAVPLLRSDYQRASMGIDYVAGNQAHTWALSAWFPFQGSAVYEYEPYKFRSFYLPCFGMGRMKDETIEAVIQGYTECTQIQPMMLYGDFWPMTPYSLDDDNWMAWQFNRVEEGDGCVQAFRRKDCRKNNIKVKLRGLDAKATYLIKDFDKPAKRMRMSGKELMKNGIKVKITDMPGAAVLVYEKMGQEPYNK